MGQAITGGDMLAVICWLCRSHPVAGLPFRRGACQAASCPVASPGDQKQVTLSADVTGTLRDHIYAGNLPAACP
jgi:hypothetical protein|eukprot:SAG25_NODE_330_length_9688_cov_5.158202_6_plen_74_part_00